MPVTIFTHPDCLKHEMGFGHPESPQRLQAIIAALKSAPFADQLVWKTPPQATKEALIRVHDPAYVDSIFSHAPKSGYLRLDPDTAMNPYTLSAALYAAGACVAAVDEVFQDHAKHVFCCVRPPGHHAEPNSAMGFCFFNNIAVGIAQALEKYHCQRVALVDFDVHHGNGSESMFFNQPKVLFWSSFQHPFYPGVSLSHKPSHIHLCPLSAGTKSAVFRGHVNQELIPLLETFKPECIFISAGFDAHQLDPLANINLVAADYAFITQELCRIAEKYSKGRLISSLEGGYHLQALAESVVAHVQTML